MQQAKAQTIWLDCDPGLDDTFAIIYAAHAPGINLLGISTSPGNTNLNNTTQNALDVLYNIGRSDVPVISGSNQLIKGQMKLAEYMHGSNGLGGVQLPTSPKKAQREQGLQKIFKKISSWEGKIIWVNTGSLTNLAILFLTYPELKQKIEKIVIMGGAIGKGNISPAAQFNIFFDPHACADVLRMKGNIPFVMIPLQVTHQNIATQDVFDHFKDQKHIPFAKACHNMLEQYQKMYYNAYKMEYPPIHDPCTIHYILHPEQFQTKKAKIDVDTGPVSYGRTNIWFQSIRYPGVTEGTQNYVTTNLKSQNQFWQKMLKILDSIFSTEIQNLIDSK